MGAFLYYGFLILAKIKKADHYEIKHYLPLQMFEMVDVTEGGLLLDGNCASDKLTTFSRILASFNSPYVPRSSLGACRRVRRRKGCMGCSDV